MPTHIMPDDHGDFPGGPRLYAALLIAWAVFFIVVVLCN